MSGVLFSAATPEVSTGTAAKTILQVIAASNHRVKLHELSVSFQGVSTTGEPILVQVARQTTAGSGTSANNPVKDCPGDDETLQTTATRAATSEPTTTDVLIAELIHPQFGYTWQSQYGKEIVIPGGTRLGIIVTADASVDCVARVRGEE